MNSKICFLWELSHKQQSCILLKLYIQIYTWFFIPTKIWWTPTLYQMIQTACMKWFFFPSPEMHFPGGSVVKNPPAMLETWVWSLGGKILWRRKWQPTPVFLHQRQKEISWPALSPQGFNTQENHPISAWVVLIIYYLPTPFNVAPIKVLIIVIQQPLSGTILYLLQLDHEFHTHTHTHIHTQKLLLIKKQQIALINWNPGVSIFFNLLPFITRKFHKSNQCIHKPFSKEMVLPQIQI